VSNQLKTITSGFLTILGLSCWMNERYTMYTLSQIERPNVNLTIWLEERLKGLFTPKALLGHGS
jgi:hypothetical protein